MKRVWEILRIVNDNIEGNCYHEISNESDELLFLHCYRSEEKYCRITLPYFCNYSNSFIALRLIEFCKECEK